MKTYSRFFILSGMSILALAIRIFSWYMDSTISRDSIYYIRMAELWHEYGSYSIMLKQFPGWEWIPFFMVWLMKLLVGFGMSGEAAGIILVITLGSLLPLIIYAIAQVVCNSREIAFGAALLGVVHPTLTEMSTEILRDTPYLFFAGLAVLFLLNAVKYQKWWQWFLGGVMVAIAIMIRYESAELLVLALGYLLIAPFFKWTGYRSICISLTCFFLAFIMTILLLFQLAEISPGKYGDQYNTRITNDYFEMFKRNLVDND
ncbi:MAG: glycosyltransferase family 39 protein [Victivallaceae bacterium]|nr:glycosyltransferase family 39 protein [Victivallaceae bacterium]MDD3116022.1 glycosyltransferase family 39 protein [Victivallaceae bacterium]